MQKTKLLETEYKKASRLEELAQEAELALDTSKYNQEMNLQTLIPYSTSHYQCHKYLLATPTLTPGTGSKGIGAKQGKKTRNRKRPNKGKTTSRG